MLTNANVTRKSIVGSLFALTILGFAPAKAAQPQVCEIYNDYVSSQCVEKSELKKNIDPRVKADYSADNCRAESFSMILETDENARGKCELSHDGKLSPIQKSEGL